MKFLNIPIDQMKQSLDKRTLYQRQGRVTKVVGLTLEVEGIQPFMGELCYIRVKESGESVPAEVVGFKGDKALMMVLGHVSGIGPDAIVTPTGRALDVEVGDHLLGQILDGLGTPIEPIEGRGLRWPIDREPPNPLKRKRIDQIISTGVRAIDGLLTVGVGQRVAINAGSGVGKSTLLGMIAQNASADVNVICLIGERGREVLEFIERDLGPEGMKKSVVVCATSDQPALVRIKSAYVATTIAEYFRDQGKNVMLMMDSVTRFAMAQREVGLATGEPPTSKGYTPSVFALLPRLLERAGMGETGSITAFYTVLVDGDDFSEPICDACRGILDGHIVLSRQLASQNHFPAIDIGLSISRLMKELVPAPHEEAAGKVRDLMALYAKNEDLINIGAYKVGSNPMIDLAIERSASIQSFLRQKVNESSTFEASIQALEKIAQ